MGPIDDLAEQDPEVIRREIDSTRSALTEKLEALEDRVMDTAQGVWETGEESIQTAREAVAETIAAVKTSVRETVATAKHAFDIRHHVEEHPWAMVGGCCLSGLALGSLVRGKRRDRQTLDRMTRTEPSTFVRPPALAKQAGNGSTVATDSSGPRFHSAPPSRTSPLDQFHEEINQAKGMVIGYLMGRVRDSIKRSLPQLAPQIDRLMSDVTTKLGGESVQQPSHEQ